MIIFLIIIAQMH
jgi:basic amino acid/polyamine antiporter, APA family